MRIYLAGPINHCDDAQASGWRQQAAQALHDFEVLDPMRRDYRGREQAHYREIVHSDLIDVRGCDLVLANCWRPSVGTAMEIVYATLADVRVYVVVPDLRTAHPWLAFHATRLFDSLSEALNAVRERSLS